MALAQVEQGVRNGAKGKRVDVLLASRFDIRSVTKAFKHLPLEILKPGIFQTRRNFKKDKMLELAASLEATGSNITPVIVRPLKFTGGYEIICGERLWRAAQQIELETLLCCIGDFSDDQALYLSGVHNIQREDLNPLEEAQSYGLLLNTGMTHKDVADEVGKSRAHVSNHLRLLSLPLAVRDLIGNEKLSFAQARPICSLSFSALQIAIAKKAVEKKWSSKRVESEVASARETRQRPDRKPAMTEDVDIKRLRNLVAEQTGYPCVIIKKETGGWQIGFSAGTSDEFQGLLDRLGVETESL